MIRPVLLAFDRLAAPITWLGVDYPQFRTILEAKLTLDTRRQMMGLNTGKAASKKSSLWPSLTFYALMGLVVGGVLTMAHSRLLGTTVAYSYIMTLIAMSLVADFSSVLLDTTDNAILQPRPVDGRTILAARLAHILVYLSLLSLSVSLATLGFGSSRFGAWFTPAFLLSLVPCLCLIVCVANVFYLVAMRLVSGERLRDIIVYVQIALTLLVVAGSQVLPRLVDMKDVTGLRIDDRWWVYLLPSAWMAGIVEVVMGNAGRTELRLAALGIMVPTLGIVLVVRVLAPSFGRQLAELDQGSTRPPAERGARLGAFFARLLCYKPTPRAAFEFVWQISSRDRQFKMRTYPSILFPMIFPILPLIADREGMQHAVAAMPNMYLLYLYMACAGVPVALVQLRFSDKWQAAALYDWVPIERPGEILFPALKAVIVRLLVPVFVVVTVLIAAAWGRHVLPDAVLAFAICLMLTGIQAVLLGRRLPFSEAYGVAESSGRFGRSMGMLVIAAALGYLHYQIKDSWPTVLLAAIPPLLLAALAMRAYGRTTWAVLQRTH